MNRYLKFGAITAIPAIFAGAREGVFGTNKLYLEDDPYDRYTLRYYNKDFPFYHVHYTLHNNTNYEDKPDIEMHKTYIRPVDVRVNFEKQTFKIPNWYTK